MPSKEQLNDLKRQGRESMYNRNAGQYTHNRGTVQTSAKDIRQRRQRRQTRAGLRDQVSKRNSHWEGTE